MIKNNLSEDYEVIIIGAGQAGLAIGYYLAQAKVSFTILDRSKKVGDVWRQRYDSLKLFTPRMYCSLPGLKLEGDPNGFPSKNEIADYLENYSIKFNLPIQHNTTVTNLSRSDGLFEVETDKDIYTAKKVIVATGTFHKPYIPEFSKNILTDTVQLHTSSYKNATQLRNGTVLIVGAGNSGAQIAVELANSHKVTLSTHPSRLKYLTTILGKDISWWGDTLGLYKISGTSWLGKYICKVIRSGRRPIRGFKLKHLLEENVITLKPKVKIFEDQQVVFEDGQTETYDNIIWATGFTPDYSWININLHKDSKGYPMLKEGESNIAGLYFLGLLCEPGILSGSINFISNDANILYQKLLYN